MCDRRIRAFLVVGGVSAGVAVFLAGQFFLATSRIWFARMGVSVGLRSHLPMWPLSPTADGPAIVVGEVHHPVRAIESPAPEWLTIPERGLYTGVAIVGAVGSGKTSACMHQFARQLLSWHATNPERRAAALVLEVKGDSCHDIRRMLTELGQRWRLHRAVPRWPADIEPAECDLAPCVLARLHGRVPLESPLRQGQRTLLAPGWRNPKHVQNWQASLTRHAFPRIGDVPGSELTTADVIEALAAHSGRHHYCRPSG